MHIVPLVVGDERDTLRLCHAAIEQGVFAQAIRPPTVPAGTSRLRLTAMASHTASDMRLAAGVLAAAARKLGLDPREIGSPPGDPEPAVEPVEHEPYEERERTAERAQRTAPVPSAPFDIEAPRPRRPPAPPASTDTDAPAPFDGEREEAVAHAA